MLPGAVVAGQVHEMDDQRLANKYRLSRNSTLVFPRSDLRLDLQVPFRVMEVVTVGVVGVVEQQGPRQMGKLMRMRKQKSTLTRKEMETMRNTKSKTMMSSLCHGNEER